ncbi:MAG: glycosyltransferase family 2 protein [Oscillospiraceae bacterium]
MSNNIKISMVTVTFNSERTLSDTLDSVLGQTHRPLEYIIVDGGSSDRTMEIVSSYKSRFESAGIEYRYHSEKDNGISDAFNKGIRQASGEIVGMINSDDMLEKGALDTVAEKYSPDTGVYYGNCIIFNDNSSDKYIAVPKFSMDETLLRKRMPIYHPATFILKKTYDEYGLYDTELKYCMDREWMLRTYTQGVKFLYIDSVLAWYREGGTNQINHSKTLKENRLISVKYGMNPIEAGIRTVTTVIHDMLWKIIQKVGLEKLFHKKV